MTVTLKSMLSEIDSGEYIMPERIAWFRDMLGGAIANAEDAIRLFQRYKPHPAVNWPEGETERAIARSQNRIELCQQALASLASRAANPQNEEVKRGHAQTA